MSLRAKVLLILALTVLVYAGADHWLQRTRVFDSYVALEEREAHEDLQRVVEGIHAEIQHLDDVCRSWAAWDDTVEFVAEPTARYVTSNLSDEVVLDRRRLDLVVICDADGNVVFHRAADPVTREPLSFRRLPSGALSTTHPLLRIDAPTDGVRGVYSTEHGPLLVSARPILTSAGDGPIRGTVIVGRLLGDALVADLSTQVSVAFEVFTEDQGGLEDFEEEIRTELTVSGWAASRKESIEARGEIPRTSVAGDRDEDREILSQAYYETRSVTQVRDETELLAYTAYPDIELAPALFLRARIPRAITQQGRASITYSAGSTVAASLLLMLVLTVLLRRVVLNPVRRLTDHAVMIGRTEDFTAELKLERGDEVGVLSREFDAMMRRLDQSKAALANASRAAGMSEIATGVLHNVGNALNSVNVSATMAANKARNSCASDLEKMLAVVSSSGKGLAEFLAEDPRGRHFEPMLQQVVKQLGEEREGLSRELLDVNEGLEHIKELVRTQQSFAGRAGVLEKTALGRLVDQTLNICGLGGTSGSPIRIERTGDDLPPFEMDRNRVLEVLVNLVQNAKQSIQEADRGDGTIRITVATAADDRVRIEVGDDGLGIPTENLANIFNHGFTTKPKGHGFGLHTSANAATEMKGRLTAHSDGPGTGATFVLEIPGRVEQREREAA